MVGRILYITVKQDSCGRKRVLFIESKRVIGRIFYRIGRISRITALLEENLFVKFSRNREEYVTV